MPASILNAPWNLSTQNVQNHFVDTTEPDWESGNLLDNIAGDISRMRMAEEHASFVTCIAGGPHSEYDYPDADYYWSQVDNAAYYLEAVIPSIDSMA